jgi:threonine dehydrogenase-like Zn-dependent dehydrogenase
MRSSNAPAVNRACAALWRRPCRARSADNKELRVLGCFTYIDEFTEVISLLTDGGLQVVDLTSEIAGIDDAPAAFERLRDASTMKIFIAPNGS